MTLASCRYGGRCNLAICPGCTYRKSVQRRDELILVAGAIQPKRLTLSTFAISDTPVEGLRDICSSAATAIKKTLTKLKVRGAVARIEYPVSPLDSDLHRAHLHVIADTATSGRGFVPEPVWAETFFDQLPNQYHPQKDFVWHSGIIECISASAAYVTKGPYVGARIEDVPFITSGIDAMTGLPQYSAFGSLRAT